MNTPPKRSKVLVATVTGSIIAAFLISLANTIGFSIRYGFDWSDPLMFVLAMVFGIPTALVLGVPVGFAISWLVGRTGPPSALRGVLAGALTGLSLAAAFIASGFEHYQNLQEAMPLLAGMPLVGAISGVAAFLAHFRTSLSPP